MAANTIARRHALVVIGAITPCFMACVAPPVGTPLEDIDDPHDPDDDDSGSPAKPEDPSTEGDDAAPVADEDASSPSSEDTGSASPTSDTGAAAKDSGTSGGGAADTGSGGATGGGGTSVTCPSLTDAGAVTSLPVNTWKRVSGTAVFILGHDSSGIYAYSAKCTHHSSVTIGAPNSSGVSTCPSHGAQFDGNGNVIRGPASAALKHYSVTVCGGKIYVDTSKTVSASTRA